MTAVPPLAVLDYGVAGLTALALIAGGIVLFAVGKGRAVPAPRRPGRNSRRSSAPAAERVPATARVLTC